MPMLNARSGPRDCLHYPHFFFFWIPFSSCCSNWLLFSALCSKSLIWFSASSTLLLFPCKLFFISISVSFVSDWIFFMILRSSLSYLSILITSVLNSASNRLLSSISFSSFSGVWILPSCGPYFFVSSFWQPPCVCFYILGRATLTVSS